MTLLIQQVGEKYLCRVNFIQERRLIFNDQF